MSGGWEEGPKGFGLAHVKQQGKPAHPDDLNCDMTDEQYERQLAAYLKSLEGTEA